MASQPSTQNRVIPVSRLLRINTKVRISGEPIVLAGALAGFTSLEKYNLLPGLRFVDKLRVVPPQNTAFRSLFA